MRILVTGSAGHLGEALVRTLQTGQHEVEGLDILDSPFTTHVGSICDSDFLGDMMRGVDSVIHTAALHKPHVATHSRRAFVTTNVAGTLGVLEAALATRTIERVTKIFRDSHGELGIHALQCNALQCNVQVIDLAEDRLPQLANPDLNHAYSGGLTL